VQDSVGVFSIRGQITTVAATARLGVQYAASATNQAEVLYFKISQSGSIVSAMDSVSLVRMTAAATVTIGAVGTNIFDYTHNSSGGQTFRGTLSTSATGTVGTTAGTPGDVVHQMDFNVLAGYEWNAQPNMRIWVPLSGIIGVRCDAVVALTYNVTMVVREMF